MNILVSNRQKVARLDCPGIRRLTVFFMNRARRGALCKWDDLSLVLMDDSGMMRINRLYLDRAGATDVISFYCPPGPGRPGVCGGEIFVNVQRAMEAGKKRWGAQRELALYIAHGCDHVTGASDRSQSGRARMRRRELRWLRAAAKDKLLNSLLSIR